MPKTYEAIYDDGRLKWLGEQPGPGRQHVLVTVLSHSEPSSHSRAEVRQMLEATRGAWGTGSSLEAVDAEVQQLRDEWDRLDRSA